MSANMSNKTIFQELPNKHIDVDELINVQQQSAEKISG
jgi:hypothetical protein